MFRGAKLSDSLVSLNTPKQALFTERGWKAWKSGAYSVTYFNAQSMWGQRGTISLSKDIDFTTSLAA